MGGLDDGRWSRRVGRGVQPAPIGRRGCGAVRCGVCRRRVGPTDRAEGLRDAPACGELAGRADVGGRRGPRVGRCSTRGCMCVCLSLSLSIFRCACVLSPRWDRLPGYEPWTAGETEAEAKAEASAVHDRKRDGSGEGKRVRAGAGRRATRFGCPGEISRADHIAHVCASVGGLRSNAPRSGPSRIDQLPSVSSPPAPAPPQLSVPTHHRSHPSPRPPLQVIHHGQRLHPELRAFLWHGTSWPHSV